jgi:hypothetical protein
MTNRGAIVLTLLIVGAVTTPKVAHADDNRFAVVTIRNDTQDVTIHFSYRWGNGEWKEVRNLRPGSSEWISYPLDANGRAPKPQMKINEAVGAAQKVVKIFDMKFRAAPDKGTRFGYPFSIQRDKSDRDYVSVYDAGR